MKLRILARAHAPNLRPAWALLLTGIACLQLTAAGVRADETSGTWTGEIEGRGDYYLERSTRIMLPGGRVALEAPNGVRMRLQYSVDAISSASIAQTGGDADGVMTEYRHELKTGLSKTFAVGDNEINLSANGTFSYEDDYTSWLYGLTGSYSWDERNHTITLGLKRVDDSIYKNNDPAFVRNLGGLTTKLIYTELLSPTAFLNLGYQLVYLRGYLGNAYRSALIGPLPHIEQPPEERVRHNLEAMATWYLPESQTTLQLYGRVYIDSWELFAITPELRVYQQLGSLLNVRLRYRHYNQSKAGFALDVGETRYAMGYTGPVTSDPKMQKFLSHQIGLRFLLALDFLHASPLRFASRASLDLSLDYQYCTSSFGNNWIGTLGGVLPF